MLVTMQLLGITFILHVKCDLYLNSKLCSEQVDVGDFERLHDLACIHCLVANGDVKFQVNNIIRFMKDGLDLKIAKHSDQYLNKKNRVALLKNDNTRSVP